MHWTGFVDALLGVTCSLAFVALAALCLRAPARRWAIARWPIAGCCLAVQFARHQLMLWATPAELCGWTREVLWRELDPAGICAGLLVGVTLYALEHLAFGLHHVRSASEEPVRAWFPMIAAFSYATLLATCQPVPFLDLAYVRAATCSEAAVPNLIVCACAALTWCLARWRDDAECTCTGIALALLSTSACVLFWLGWFLHGCMLVVLACSMLFGAASAAVVMALLTCGVAVAHHLDMLGAPWIAPLWTNGPCALLFGSFPAYDTHLTLNVWPSAWQLVLGTGIVPIAAASVALVAGIWPAERDTPTPHLAKTVLLASWAFGICAARNLDGVCAPAFMPFGLRPASACWFVLCTALAFSLVREGVRHRASAPREGQAQAAGATPHLASAHARGIPCRAECEHRENDVRATETGLLPMLLSLALATCLVCGEVTYLQAQDDPFAGWVECVRKVDAKGSTLRVCIVGTSDDDRVLYVAMTREDAANPASTFAVEKTVRPLGYELSSVRLMDARLLPYLTEDEDFHDLEHRAPSRYYLGTWL